MRGSCGGGLLSHSRRRRAGRGPSTACPPGGAPSSGCVPPESLWEGLTRVRWRAPCPAGGLGSRGGGLLCFGSRGDGPPGLTGIGCRDALAWRFLGPGPWCGVRLRGPKGSACPKGIGSSTGGPKEGAAGPRGPTPWCWGPAHAGSTHRLTGPQCESRWMVAKEGVMHQHDAVVPPSGPCGRA